MVYQGLSLTLIEITYQIVNLSFQLGINVFELDSPSFPEFVKIFGTNIYVVK